MKLGGMGAMQLSRALTQTHRNHLVKLKFVWSIRKWLWLALAPLPLSKCNQQAGSFENENSKPVSFFSVESFPFIPKSAIHSATSPCWKQVPHDSTVMVFPWSLWHDVVTWYAIKNIKNLGHFRTRILGRNKRNPWKLRGFAPSLWKWLCSRQNDALICTW
jgi:hypothetical protein